MTAPEEYGPPNAWTTVQDVRPDLDAAFAFVVQTIDRMNFSDMPTVTLNPFVRHNTLTSEFEVMYACKVVGRIDGKKHTDPGAGIIPADDDD
jgi:hypothetical protein